MSGFSRSGIDQSEEIDSLEKTLAPLFRDGAVSESEFLRIVSRLNRADPRDAKLADELVPGASDVLDRGYLGAIIRADISVKDAAALVAATKQRFRQYLPLISTLFSYLKLESPEDALNVLRRIDDCCLDAPAIAKAGRRDANKRKLVRQLEAARDLIAETVLASEKLRYTVGAEFETIKDVHDGNAVPIGGWSPPTFRLDDLFQGLHFLAAAMEIKKAQIEDGHDERSIEDNQVKMRIVDCAYDLTRVYGGPTFVTTPGSDFSFVCSLIYEMAMGKPDESMAGAISRFARSTTKQEADEYDREYDDDADRLKEHDNFANSRSTVERYLEEAKRYGPYVKDKRLDKEARYSALRLFGRAIERAEAAANEMGPFLLWMDQYSDADLNAFAAERAEWDERLRAADQRLGELRRRELKISLREYRP